MRTASEGISSDKLMNRFNMLLFFVLLCSQLFGIGQCCNNSNIHHLSQIMNYSFEEFSCVQMFSLGDIPWQYYQILPALRVPVMINQTSKYCYGFALFATDTVHLRKMLAAIEKYYDKRIVCYLHCEDSKIKDLVKKETDLFGESEALITDGNLTYKYDQIERRFYELKMNGEKETWKKKLIMNFKGREITVAGFNVSMFTEYGPVDEKGHPAWNKGIEHNIFSMLTPLMNISWKLMVMNDKWGLKLPNGTWTAGLFKAMLAGEADIAMGSIWLTIDKYESLPLSIPILKVCVQHLIRRPTFSNAIWVSFFRHYRLSLLALLSLAAFINIFAILLISYCINRFRNNSTHKMETKREDLELGMVVSLNIVRGDFIHFDFGFLGQLLIFLNEENVLAIQEWSIISSCSLMTFGAISLDTNIPQHKNPGPVRLLLSCWAITTFIFMTSFGSSLIYHLTTPDLYHKPETVERLVEGGYFWGLTYLPDFERILDLSNPWHKKWTKRFVLIKDKEEHMRLLKNDKFVLWGKTTGKGYFAMNEDYWKSDLLSEFELSSEKLAHFYTTFVFAPGSQLSPAVNIYLRRIIETGHLVRHLVGMMMMEGDSYMLEVTAKTKPPTIGYSRLTLSQFQGVFYILFVGLSMATIFFFAEIVYYKNKIK